MNPVQIQTVQECARATLAGEIEFPEVVQRLLAIGVERYHADYSRGETTYYLSTGESHVVVIPHPEHPVGTTFSQPDVIQAVQQSQRGEHTYQDFLRKTTAAGCIGYFVQITGRRVLYFGRNGDSHTEHFPPAPAA